MFAPLVIPRLVTHARQVFEGLKQKFVTNPCEGLVTRLASFWPDWRMSVSDPGLGGLSGLQVIVAGSRHDDVPWREEVMDSVSAVAIVALGAILATAS